MAVTGPTSIQDDSDETITDFLARLDDSGSEEQGIYRESEIDAIYNIVEVRHRHLVGSHATPAEVVRSDENLDRVREAHDLVHEGRIREAAKILRDWLRGRA